MPEDYTEVDMKTCDGMFIKQIALPKAGMIVPQHVHAWDHSTLLARGRIVVWCEGKEPRYYEAPAIVEILAGVGHEFQVLEDNTLLYCLHNLHGAEAVAVLREHDLEEAGFADALA